MKNEMLFLLSLFITIMALCLNFGVSLYGTPSLFHWQVTLSYLVLWGVIIYIATSRATALQLYCVIFWSLTFFSETMINIAFSNSPFNSIFGFFIFIPFFLLPPLRGLEFIIPTHIDFFQSVMLVSGFFICFILLKSKFFSKTKPK